MKLASATSKEATERYAAWERNAASALVALVVVLAASFYFHSPSFPFVACNLLSGVFIFFSYRMGMKQQTSMTLVLVLFALIFGLLAISIEVQQSLPILLSQGIGLIGIALFTCILAVRKPASISDTGD